MSDAGAICRLWNESEIVFRSVRMEMLSSMDSLQRMSDDMAATRVAFGNCGTFRLSSNNRYPIYQYFFPLRGCIDIPSRDCLRRKRRSWGRRCQTGRGFARKSDACLALDTL